jgi:HSP20 family molecular chaperone IbpA
MNTRQLPHPSTRETSVPIIPVAPEEQSRRIEAAIAARAYEIFEKRGGMGWHELEDWRQAEAEVRSKVCFGFTTGDHAVVIGTDAAGFEPGTLEIWVAPRQLTICGKTRAQSAHPAKPHLDSREHLIFRQVQLPCEVQCAGARAHHSARFLEIQLRRAESMQTLSRADAA